MRRAVATGRGGTGRSRRSAAAGSSSSARPSRAQRQAPGCDPAASSGRSAGARSRSAVAWQHEQRDVVALLAVLELEQRLVDRAWRSRRPRRPVAARAAPPGARRRSAPSRAARVRDAVGVEHQRLAGRERHVGLVHGRPRTRPAACPAAPTVGTVAAGASSERRRDGRRRRRRRRRAPARRATIRAQHARCTAAAVGVAHSVALSRSSTRAGVRSYMAAVRIV